MNSQKKTSTVMLAIAILVMFVAVAVYIYINMDSVDMFSNKNTDLTSFFEPTGVSVKYDNSRDIFFYATENGDFYYCTDSTVKFLTPTGQLKWEAAIDVINPVAVGNGSCIAIGEINGKVLYVLGRTGLLYRKNFETQNILNFSVNKQGYSSIVLQNGSSYETVVLDDKGANIWEWVYQLPNIYPVTTAVSHDNRILANSILNSTDYLISEVMFAFLNKDEARGYTDTIFKSMIKENQIVPAVMFLDNKTVIIMSDNNISGATFTGGSDVKNEWDMEIGNKIDAYTVYGSKGIAVAFGEGFINKTSEKPGTVNFYNASGAETGTFFEGGRVTYMSATDNNVVIGIGRTYYGVTEKGKILWQYDSTTDLKDVFLLNNTDTILSVSQTEAVVLKRK